MQKQILLLGVFGHPKSNTQTLAHWVLDGLDYTTINLADRHLNFIQDQRWAPLWLPPVDDYQKILLAFPAAPTLVLASPIYWYGLAARLKAFIERWSETLALDPTFRQRIACKRLILLMVGGDDPRVKAQPIVQQVAEICAFLGMTLQATVIGQANRPGSLSNDPVAVRQAASLNQDLKAVGQ